MKKSTHLQLFAMLLFSGALYAQTNTFPATGNAGVGTLTPTSTLQVVGTTQLGGNTNGLTVDANGNLTFAGNAGYKVGGNKYAFQFSGNANYGLFFNQASVRYEFRNSAAAATFFVGADNGNGYFLGNLGLGVQSATAKLDVAGAVKIADGTQGAGKVLTSDANGLASWQTPSGGGTITGTGTAGNISFWSGASALGSNTNLFWDNTNLRLGIKNATPAAALDVAGNVKIADGTQGAGKVLTSDANGVATWQTPSAVSGAGVPGNLAFWSAGTVISNNTNLVWDNTNARLGIGSPIPQNRLDVGGPGGLRSSSTNGGSGSVDWIAGNFGGTTGDRVVMGILNGRATIGAHNIGLTAWAPLSINQGGGNVGINTTSANGQLQLSNIITNRKIVLWEDANNDHQYYGFGINSLTLRYQTSSTSADHVFFAGSSSTTSNELMRIKGTGNVGIGTNVPGARLHIKETANSWPTEILESGSTVGTWLSIGNSSTNGKWFSLIATGSGNGEGAGKLLFTTNGSASQVKTSNVLVLDSNANVMMGTNVPATGYRLTVAGKVICTELKVQLQPFPDYVFEKNYKLRTLKEVENHIDTYKRLPGMPSAKEVESGGMNVGEMQGKVVEKVEELTLYIIQQQKQIEVLEQLVEKLQQAAEKK